MKHPLTVVLIATALASPAKGEMNLIFSVQDYFLECEPARVDPADDILNITQEGICIGVAQGIAGVAHLNCSLDMPNIPFALKSDLTDVSVGAYAQALWNYARDNPATWQDSVGALIVGLSQTWPCE